MRVVLDTSILVAAGRELPDLSGLEGRVSSVSYAEMNFGLAVTRSELERANRLGRIQRVSAIFGAGIPFDDLVASSYGLLFGLSYAAGKRSRTRVADLMIAATAHSLAVPLVTRNVTDFDAVTGAVEVISR